MAKGVKSITGNASPEVGEKNFYEVSSFYQGTVIKNENEIKWKLYTQQSSGNWRELRGPQKTGKKVPFSFPEKWLGKKLLIEAFVYNPEVKSPPGLIVAPKTAKIPRINKVELFYVDDKKGSVFSFMEKLRARAYCVNMFLKELTFTLWEDDVKGGGHNTSNKPIDTLKARVDKNGVAVVEFPLSKAMMKKAMEGEVDVKQLEFYVTVEYYKNKKHATKNVDVDNPNPKVPINPPKKTEPKQPPIAKGSPAESKPKSKKEEKGILDKIEEKWDELWDWWETPGTIKKEQQPTVQKPEGRSVSIVQEPPEKKEEKEKCFCNRDFEEKDVRKLVKLLKGTETIWEGQALKGGKRAECNISDKSFGTLTKELNNAIKKYKINTCAQKMHFLAQVCEETGTFALSEETKSKYASSTSVYKGRGLLQLTGVKKEGEDSYDSPGPYKDYADYKGDQRIVKTPEIVANNVHYCIDSGAWIWSVNKKMTNNPKSAAIIKWGKETLGKSLNELAVYVDKYLELISVLLNGRNSETGMPNGWAIRQSNYNTLKNFFFMYDRFHGDNHKPADAKDIVTYHIYANGEIEKHIPKSIKSGYEKKYAYIYHDKSGSLHELGTYDIIPTQVYGGVKGTKVNLINLDKVKKSYKKENYQYTFNVDSPRKYVNEKTLASIFGAMLEVNYNDISCNGFSHPDGSSKPSVSHINGNNGDFKYLRKDKKLMFGDGTSLDISANPDMLDDVRQNKWNDALYKFGWKSMLGWTYKRNGKVNYLNHLPKNTKNHHHHLHVQGYKPSFKEIKK